MPYYNQAAKERLNQLKDQLADSIYQIVGELHVKAWITSEPVPFSQRTSGKSLAISPGTKWGDLFGCGWFHFTGQVPSVAKGKNIVLLIDLNGEACVVDSRGNPFQGLTNINSDFDYTLGRPGKRVVPIVANAKGNEKIDFWADAGCNDLFGKLRENGTFKEGRIAICQPEIKNLYYDIEVLWELVQQLPESSARRDRIWSALLAAADVLDPIDQSQAIKARQILRPELAQRSGDSSLKISAIGHAHMDLAWLWPIRETIRKGARTFSTVLRMMEAYPDYVFGASQAQLYDWMKTHYPYLYSQIKRKITDGRWEVQGAMWVEPDTNVPSGESLVRQIIYGKRFFRQEFGRDMKIFWLPDTFGYSPVLPQLARKSGVEFFMSAKLAWNLINQIPHHTFWWEGMDGSRILTHLLPEGTYNSSAAPRALTAIEKNFLDRQVSDRCLMLFGIGDGGGGPGEEHLERIKRQENLQGVPPLTQESAENFFQAIRKDGSRFHDWVGELYFERHQGTLTSQGRNKWFNRKIELALRDAEWLLSQSLFFQQTEYPTAKLDTIWKEVLLYQFHDILPGSSIKRVYDESLARYDILLKEIEALSLKTTCDLCADIDTANMEKPVVISNSLSWERTDYVCFKNTWKQVTVPSMGYTTIDFSTKDPKAVWDSVLIATPQLLENDLLRVSFDRTGAITSILDKEHHKEALASGTKGNRLALYEDPGNAWDFSIDYDKQVPDYFKLSSVEVRKNGPRAIIRQTYHYGKSVLRQEIVLTHNSRRLDFVTEVDWKESALMLRTSFPTAIKTSEATCEIQFGYVKRPTHRNTSWDLAKYEVAAQRCVDLSDRGYGVALLNDSKYGHKLRKNIIDLNLLRSTSDPGAEADHGVHHFTYSLYPHSGDYVSGNVARAAYDLNVPLRIIPASCHPGKRPAAASLIRVDVPNVIVDTVKKSEEGNDWIVRLYEAHGASTTANIAFGVPIQSASVVDLMEENDQKIKLLSGSAPLRFGPFEIITLKLSLKK